LLAKNVNDDACYLDNRVACTFFASKLAPTDPESGLELLHQEQLLPCKQFVAAHFYPYSEKLVY
jgi:hypothetical protein